MRTTWLRVRSIGTQAVVLGGVIPAAVACGASVGNEESRATSAAIGTRYDEVLTFPAGMGHWNTAVAAFDGNVKINDRARVFGGAITGASAEHRVEIGADAWVRDIVTLGDVFMRQNASSTGITVGLGSTVTSQRQTPWPHEVKSLTPLNLNPVTVNPVWRSEGPVFVEDYGPRAPAYVLEEGVEYSYLAVKPGAVLEVHPGTYHIENLVMEPGSVMLLRNREPINVVTLRNLIMRGEMRMDHDGAANILFAHLAGAEPAITARFVGTLFAPHTGITLYENPGGRNHTGYAAVRELSHVGAFYGKEFEAHQQTSIVHEPWNAHCVRPPLEMVNRPDVIGHDDLEDGIRTHEAQGIAAGDDSWYVFTAKKGDSRIWRYPLQGSLLDHMRSGNGTWVPNPEPARTGDHPGAGVFANGRLYVAGHGHTILVFDRDLNYLGMADASAPNLPGWSLESGTAWIAHDPVSDRFYSSEFELAWHAESFEIVDCFETNDCSPRTVERFEPRHPKRVHFVEAGTAWPQGIRRVQGGAVSNQTLYLASDTAAGGIFAIDLSYFNVDRERRHTGHVRGFQSLPIDKNAGDRCKRAVYPACFAVGGLFGGPLAGLAACYALDDEVGGKCDGLDEELEGLTVHDGGIYAVLLENDFPSADSLILKHVDIVTDPNAGACNGAQQ